MYMSKVIVALALLAPTAHALGTPDAEERRLLDCTTNAAWRRVDGKGVLVDEQDCEWVGKDAGGRCVKWGSVAGDVTAVQAFAACPGYCDGACKGIPNNPTTTSTGTTTAATTTTTLSCANNEDWYRVSAKKDRVEYDHGCEWVRQDAAGRCMKWGTSDTTAYELNPQGSVLSLIHISEPTRPY